MDKHDSFGTAINCMDGRVQLPVNEYLRTEYGVKYVDTITEPGPNKILAEYEDLHIIENIKARVEVSTKLHDSKIIAIVAHYDCGGNPAGKEEQIEQVHTAIENVKKWNNEVEVIGLWVDENWVANRI